MWSFKKAGICCLTVLEARMQKSSCQQDHAPPKAMGNNDSWPTAGFWLLAVIFAALWFANASQFNPLPLSEGEQMPVTKKLESNVNEPEISLKNFTCIGIFYNIRVFTLAYYCLWEIIFLKS